MTSQTAQRGHEAPAAAQPATITTVGDLMPEDLAVAISEGIERAYTHSTSEPMDHSVEFDLESVVNTWRYEVEGIFALWACDSDDCPGRPSWEADLRAALWTKDDSLVEHVADTVRAWLVSRLMRFAETHTEARLSIAGPEAVATP